MVTAVTGALTTLVLARMLGPAGAGVYAISLSLFLGLLTVGSLGLQTGVSYLVGAGRWSARRALAQTQLMALLLGFLSAGVGIGVSELVPSAFQGLGTTSVLLTAASVPCALSWTFASYVALAIDHYELYSVPPALQSSLTLVAAPLLASKHGAQGAVAALALSNAVAALVTLFAVARLVRKRSGSRGERGRLWEALGFGLQTHASNVLSFLNYRADMFILNAYAGEADVGRYSIAVSFTTAVWLLPRALSTLVVPRVALLSSAKGDETEAHRAMVETKSIRHTTLLVLASSAFLAAALVVIVVLLYGPNFRPAIVLGLILLPGTALLGIAGVLGSIIVGRGRPTLTLWAALVTTPVAVVLYLVLVPKLGAVGAATASTLSYTFGFVIGAWLYRRAVGPGVIQAMIPTRDELADYRRLVRRRREAV